MKRLLVWIIVCFISTCGYTYLYCKINNVKKLSKIAILIFLAGVVVSTISKYYNFKYFTLLSYFVFYPILFFTIHKMPIKKIIINTLIIGLIAIIFDLISMLFSTSFCYIFGIDLEKYYSIFSIILTLSMFLAFMGIGYWNKTRNLFSKIIKFFDDIGYFDYALIIFCLFIFALAIFIFGDLDRIKIDILLFIIIVLLLFSFTLLVNYKINDIENKKYLEMLKENNDFYIKMDDENRIFKHNLMAKLTSIKSVSNKKAIALIDDFVIKTNKNIKFSKKIKEIPYGLNGIIYQKTYPYLEDINFRITNKISFDIFKVLKPRRYNVLVEKMIVSLDNAIEASLNSKNKVVVINLYDIDENIYIEIKNTFAHNIDVDNLGSVNYSTKGQKRGLGLFSALRNNEASLRVKVINGYFISLISAKKQK